MKTFRLLPDQESTAAMNMALDEALLESVSAKKSLPTLRFYTWKPCAVSVGYFQSMDEEVNIPFCRKHNIDAVRRMTGGGAVFHDKEITYSLIFREDENLVSKNILASYEKICSGIVVGLRQFGINARFAPLNDILVGTKKISGNAQTRRMGCVLQHGTILLDVDHERMFSALRIPDEKIKDKLIASAKERVSGIYAVLPRVLQSPSSSFSSSSSSTTISSSSPSSFSTFPSFESIRDALATGFSQVLCINLKRVPLLSGEKVRARQLAQAKYQSQEWNFKR
ncbi:lipoate--protein ligase family protein [Candidatus Woesearchaeota archaeon CG_4_10_14_0_8_um_filter_47_5]|nr:MAG: lipoate--protein ligase family protein [Candidatus Woesearchaeota archaeon CG_4_10_14_0_8_um_filter_47_5]